MVLQRVTTEKAVHQLVAHLLSATRRRPVAVVSTRNHEREPLIDAEYIQTEAGHLADVVVIPTGPLTYEMESLMVVGTHVFGGAGRVYPPGTGWERDNRQSPLRFAHDPDAAVRSAEKLVDDVLAAAHRPMIAADQGNPGSTATGNSPPEVPETDAGELQAALVTIATLKQQMVDLRGKHTEQLTAARKKTSKNRPADTLTPTIYDTGLFLNTDDAVRYAVHLTWVQRIPATDKAVLSVQDYDISAAFAGSLEKLDEAQLSKALKCVVDVLTDLSRQMPTRRVHPLRTAVGPDAPVTRSDGATCYRASIEAQTASARRLHYWKLPSGRIELSRIVNHDDMTP